MYQKYKDRARFLFVYILEAHPDDGWQMNANIRENVIYNQPKTAVERARIALACRRGLKLDMPVLVDDMKNSTNNAYAAWPVRMYVVGKDGRMAYVGGPGPGGFKPVEVGRFLESYLPKEAALERPADEGLIDEDLIDEGPIDQGPTEAEAVETGASVRPKPVPAVPPVPEEQASVPEPHPGPAAGRAPPEDAAPKTRPQDAQPPVVRKGREPKSAPASALKYVAAGLAVLVPAGAALVWYRRRSSVQSGRGRRKPVERRQRRR